MKIQVWKDAAVISPVVSRWELGLSEDTRGPSGSWPVIELALEPGAGADPPRVGPFVVLPNPEPFASALGDVAKLLADGGFVADLLVRDTFIRAESIQRKLGWVRMGAKRERDCVIVVSADSTRFCVERAPFFEADVVDRTRWLSLMHACVVFHRPEVAISAKLVAADVLPEGPNMASWSRVLNSRWFGDSCLMYLVGTAQSDSASAVLRCPPAMIDSMCQLLGGRTGQEERERGHH